MRIEQKGTSIYISELMTSPDKIKIPSQMFPLVGQGSYLLHNENTSPLPTNAETDAIREVFDEMHPRLGSCYSNTDALIGALRKRGIDAKSMVGWLFIGDNFPIHHCFAVIEKYHAVLDFSVRASFFHELNQNSTDMQTLRKEFSRKYINALQSKMNSEIGTFGQMDSGCIMLAAVCSPRAGAATFAKLRKAFPKHPALVQTDASGATMTQQIVLEQMKR